MKSRCHIVLFLTMVMTLVGCSTSRHQVTHAPRIKHATATKQHEAAAARANVELAIAFLNRGNTLKAKEKLLRAREQSPIEPMVWYGLGFFYEKTGEFQQAEDHYLQAIKLGGKKGEPHNNYGTFLCRQKRYDDAISQFMMAINDENYLDIGSAYENAGMCALNIPNKRAARHFFQKAIDNDPNAEIALYYMAKLAIDEKQYANAYQYLRQLIDMEEQPIPEVHAMFESVKQQLR